MKGCQLALLMKNAPATMNRPTTASFSATMKLLTLADSLIPITSTTDMTATMAMAGTFSREPVVLSPLVTHPATCCVTSEASHQRNGADVRVAGRGVLK